MEFSEILMKASEQQGVNSVPKRYSLAVGPPKKDPKVKGVHSAAVQAFLRRQEEERRKKELEEKKRKEELLAKRVELKHDRKARAMASRTKDNFRGYNGIPVEEKPKRRQSCENRSDRNTEAVECVTGDEMEQLELSQTESEHESEDYDEKPPKTSVKPKAPPKSAPPQLNFMDLLKLAEKKQYEPVEIKVVKKTEERPMTAEELREREYLERKARKAIAPKEKKGEKEIKHTVASSGSKKDLSQKELLNAKHSKHSTDKHSFSKGSLCSQSGSDKKSKGAALPSNPKHAEKLKPAIKGPLKSSSTSSHSKVPVSGGGKLKLNSHPTVLKTSANGAQKQSSSVKKSSLNGAQKHSSVKEPSLKKTSSHIKPASVTAAQHESIKHSNPKQPISSSGTSGSLAQTKSSLNTGPGRPGLNTGHGLQSTSSRVGPAGRNLGSGQRSSSSSVGPGRPGSSLGMVPSKPGSSSGAVRPGSGQSSGPGRPGSMPNVGLGRGSCSGSGPGRPSSTSVGHVKPKCTVVSETISSKNLAPRLSSGHVNGMRPQQRPGIPPQGFPRPLPPITSKRPYEDEDEDDSEMEDFIDDEGEPQEEISRHIREIFGYDRSKYKDESDYALRYMESSWREQQKEEAKSLRLGMLEDLEEQRREEEELKRKKQSKKLRTR